MRTLTPAERRAFRAKAHPLHPVVTIGQHGLTPAVLHEIDVNLLAHELIKIRVFSDDRDEREALLARICAELDAAPVQHLGKILTIWRPAPPPEPEPVVRRRRAARPRDGHGGVPAQRASTPPPLAPRTATAAKRAPRRGRSVIEGLRVRKAFVSRRRPERAQQARRRSGRRRRTASPRRAAWARRAHAGAARRADSASAGARPAGQPEADGGSLLALARTRCGTQRGHPKSEWGTEDRGVRPESRGRESQP